MQTKIIHTEENKQLQTTIPGETFIILLLGNARAAEFGVTTGMTDVVPGNPGVPVITNCVCGYIDVGCPGCAIPVNMTKVSDGKYSEHSRKYLCENNVRHTRILTLLFSSMYTKRYIKTTEYIEFESNQLRKCCKGSIF